MTLGGNNPVSFSTSDLTFSGGFRGCSTDYPTCILTQTILSPDGSGAVLMDWISDSADGFYGSMHVGGVTYHTSSPSIIGESMMYMYGGPAILGPGVTSYTQPFIFQASLCGWQGTPTDWPCDFREFVTGSGTADITTSTYSDGSHYVQSIVWTFDSPAAAPEPGTLALFAAAALIWLLIGRPRERA